jgi:intraflagellar transport protein 52
VADYHYIPDTIKLSESLKSCLQEYEDIPKDFMTLFDTKLFSYNYSLVPAALELYEKLGIKQEPLTIIQPEVLYLY